MNRVLQDLAPCGLGRSDPRRRRGADGVYSLTNPSRGKKADHPLYTVWSIMRARCNNPRATSYGRYGAKGITVCERWNDPVEGFWAFVDDMGERPEGTLRSGRAAYSIDRIDGDGPYSPDNCRWADVKTQANNHRGVVRITAYSGVTMSITEWAAASHIPFGTLHSRLTLGWPIERAISEPIRGRKP